MLPLPFLRRHGKPPKLSECQPLFMAAYRLRGAGAVMHSHSMNAVLATMMDPNAHEFRCALSSAAQGAPDTHCAPSVHWGTLLHPSVCGALTNGLLRPCPRPSLSLCAHQAVAWAWVRSGTNMGAMVGS